MAKCHENRNQKTRRRARAALRAKEARHRRGFQLPPGYCVATRNYGFALYRGSWARMRHDDRIGGYGKDEYEILLQHAWEDFDQKMS